MRKLSILILIVIAFVSCDGRDRAYKSNKDVLMEANLLESFTEALKFMPEQPTKIETDTILSNGFSVKINYQSMENDFVIKTIKSKNDTITKWHYKNFEAAFLVSKNEVELTQGTINKNLFKAFENPEFWNEAIMQYVWIDYEASTDHSIQIKTSFHIPNTKTYKDFIVVVFDNGSISTKQVNNLSNFI
jgi:hypothetical protein